LKEGAGMLLLLLAFVFVSSFLLPALCEVLYIDILRGLNAAGLCRVVMRRGLAFGWPMICCGFERKRERILYCCRD
jgi:hypothetical protein